ncbi:MAG TPA: nuclear transport factor 2 family protein [Vicinamibacterales bacterium]|nr:nuclear transport factor 2 family protein [Vicinamibacterales bacterium]
MTEQIILELGEKVFSSIQTKDVDSLGRILADDFIQRGSDGLVSGRDEFLKGISAIPVDIVAVRGEHLRVDVYGDVAVMTGIQRAEWRQGDTAHGVSSVAFTDVFALRQGRWLIVLAYGVELPE